jgi:hypothetical protein
MQASKAWGVLGCFLGGALVFAHCSSSPTNQATPGPGDNPDNNIGERVVVGCDPDNVAPCVTDWFLCYNDNFGNKRCEGQQPANPTTGGGWECVEVGARLVCSAPNDRNPEITEIGESIAEDDDGFVTTQNGWVCQENDGTITCRLHSYYPQTDDDGIWNCEYVGEFRVCTIGGNGGQPPPDSPPTDGGPNNPPNDGGPNNPPNDGGPNNPPNEGPGTNGGWTCPPGIEIPSVELCGDGIDNDCDGTTDEDCPGTPPGDEDCRCVEGAWRYCDTPDFCKWGRQTCVPETLRWGRCIEIIDIPAQCSGTPEMAWYSPEAQTCCIETLGGCCQDYHDFNGNGDTNESLGDCLDIETCVPVD